MCAVGHCTYPGCLHTENLSCAQEMAWPKCTRLMLLTVVWGTAQGDDVFAQTYTKLEGILLPNHELSPGEVYWKYKLWKAEVSFVSE